ncbi:MAG TPA: ABC transporter permease [Candidatus Limnocylindria bacterium]|jgi:NitT/TauT family transport system permease protein|nr:ABC transporter permease [Candidatus Limnocylindria bacterium]
MTSDAKPFTGVAPRPRAASPSWLRRAGVPAVQLAILAVIIAAWQLCADAHLINGQLFGTPSGIVKSARQTIADGSLLTDTWLTVYETITGFILGTLLGSVLGLGLWYSRFVARVVEPAAVAFNGVPKIALGPLIIIWLGAGTESKIVLAFVSTFVVALLAAYGATREVDRDLVTLLRSVGASRWQIFRKLLVPSAMPTMFAAMRINVGFALVGAVVGEFISSQHGLGHAVFVAGNLFDLNTVWLGIIVLSLVAAIMYSCLAFAERALVKGRS